MPKSFKAIITVLEGSGGEHPAHPIVIPPDSIAPGVPTHPIYIPVYPDQGLPEEQPHPDQGLPGDQPYPDQGLPGEQPHPEHPIIIPPDAIAPGVPEHPIVIPPDGSPPYVDNTLPGDLPHPAHPIELPPLPEIPPEESENVKAIICIKAPGSDTSGVWFIVDVDGGLKPNPWPEPKGGGKRRK